MKKILFAFAAAVALFASCNQNDNTPVVEFALTDQMVAVGNENVSDANIIVDGTNVYIEIPYENKAELAALEVIFENLPEGVAVEDLTFDFSQGATAQVTFTKQSTDFVYTVSAVAAQPNPRFSKVELTYAGADEASSEDDVTSVAGSDLVVKFKSGTALNALKLAYEVLPAGTKVYKDGVEVAQNAVIDFSATDGVKFTLKCENVEKEYTVKAVTTGKSVFKRVWGLYEKPSTVSASPIYGEGGKLPLGGNRNVAINDKYVFLPHFGGSKVDVLNITDGTYVKTLDNTGIEGGFSTTTTARIIDNNGSDILLVSNMVGANGNTDPLRIYAYMDLEAAAGTEAAKPVKVLEYAQTGQRIGDKFTVEGNWQNGKLYFYSMTSSKVFIFSISSGVISSEPTVITLSDAPGPYVGVYKKFSDSEYIWTGAGKLPKVFDASGNLVLAVTDGSNYSIPTHDIAFFDYNEQKYMLFVTLANQYQDAYINIQEINTSTLVEALNAPAGKGKISIADPSGNEVTANKNGNGVAGLDVRTIDGVVYAAVVVPGSGISLFEIR